MKKFLIMFLLLTPICAIASNDPLIDFYIDKKYYGTMSYTEFYETYKSSLESNRELKAERNKHVYAVMSKDVLELRAGEEVETDIIITWKDSKGKTFKEIYTTLKIKLKEKHINKFREKYRDFSEIAFPVSLLINIGLCLILIF